MVKPDIYVNLKFYSTSDGGRGQPTPSNYFGCIFEVGGDNHDARILLENIGPIFPGDTKKSIPVKFLCSETVIPKIKSGDKLFLKEGGLVIGEAEVTDFI